MWGGTQSNGKLMQRLASWVAIAVLLIAAGCATPSGGHNREPLDPTYLKAPKYRQNPGNASPLETFRQLHHDLYSFNGRILRQRGGPNQAGVLWLSLLVGLLVAFNFDRLRTPRNLDLLLLLSVGFLFFEMVRFFGLMLEVAYRALLDWIFIAITALTFVLMVRALRRVYKPLADRWEPNPSARALATIAVLLVGLNVYVGIARDSDDAGFFVNLGGQRLRERGLLPYGDPLLTGTPAAAYGPVLYLAHVPFQMILKPRGVNWESPDLPALTGRTPYFLPPPLATRLCTVAFHLGGVAALFVAARRLRGARVAWALVALYCSSAYVIGVGSEGDLMGGMTFISHIGPASTTLIAFALLNRPAWSGAMLAVSIGVLFYPLFLVPAWMGYYWTRKPEFVRALAGFSLAAAIIGGGVLFLSRPTENRGRISTIMHDTLGHQEDSTAYGLSPFGFWGTRSGVRWQLMQPLVPGISTTRPVVLAFFVMAGAAFFVARGRRPADLALLVAAIAIGAQLWKIHGTGTYVTWYYPFLLLGFFANSPVEPNDSADPPVIVAARIHQG